MRWGNGAMEQWEIMYCVREYCADDDVNVLTNQRRYGAGRWEIGDGRWRFRT